MLASRLKCNKAILFRLCRRFCDKNIENESPAADQKDDEKAKQKIEATRTLASLLEQLDVTPSTTDTKPLMTLNLAKPPARIRKPKKTTAPTKPLQKEDVKTPQEEPVKIEPRLVTAAQTVAKVLGGDTQRTNQDLLQKLRMHAQETQESKSRRRTAGSDIRSMFAGMKIQSFNADLAHKPDDDSATKEKPPRFDGGQSSKVPRSQTQSLPDRPAEKQEVEESVLLQRMRAHMEGESEPEDLGLKMSNILSSVKVERPKEKPTRRSQFSAPTGVSVLASRVDIFGDKPLNLFKTKDEVEPNPDYPVLETWDALQKHELRLMVTPPAANAYEEMIQWTDEGKLWKFPIDNEQGLEEEAKIGFEQHVLLDQHLKGFPEGGPIRQFMELVVVGLSKNPYITVQRKIHHIDWFRQYFQEKEALLKEIDSQTETMAA